MVLLFRVHLRRNAAKEIYECQNVNGIINCKTNEQEQQNHIHALQKAITQKQKVIFRLHKEGNIFKF
jgi:hypothetical protein